MKLGPIIRNDVQVLPKNHDANRPDGGAVIKAQKCNFGHNTLTNCPIVINLGRYFQSVFGNGPTKAF